MSEPTNQPLSIEEITQHLEKLYIAVEKIAEGVKTMESSSPTFAEIAKVGQVELHSTTIKSDKLLSYILGALGDKNVGLYLGAIEKKRMSASGVG